MPTRPGPRIVRSNLRRAVWLALLVAGLAPPAQGAELRVLTAGALKPLVLAMAPEYEQRSGHRLKIENDTAGALLRRASAGERFDLVILTAEGAARLQREGQAAADGVRGLARVGIGVGVLPGAARPDLASEAGFRGALLQARAVAMIDPAAGGSSGIYLSALFERMGIGAEMRAKAVRVPGGLTALRLLDGQADLAVQQMSEILAVPGVVLAGALPPTLQNYTAYAGAVAADSLEPAATRALLDWLASADARSRFRELGLEAP